MHALTGTDPDRLKEEKRRGITIELGFADVELSPKDVVSFVDVPGHERFVRHMVAGASGIEAVLLVVALDQGVQPQTREHLEICSLLGLRHGLVALTKKDLVDDELAEVVALEVRDLLAGTFLEDAPMIPVSAKTGEGIDALRGALSNLPHAQAADSAVTVPRLPVDRSFVLRGFGTVVTGTMTGPGFREGDEVEVLPGGKRARIRGLQVHHRKVASAAGGRRTACNLQGVECEDVPRGSVLCRPDTLRPTTRFWAAVRLLPHAPRRLAAGGPVRLHHGTADYPARFRTLGESDGVLRAVVFSATPVPLVAGDRIVLRRPAPVDTIGGGLVVDAHPPHPRHAAAADFAESASQLDRAALVRLRRAGAAGLQIGEFARLLGAPRAALERCLGTLRGEGEAVEVGGRWFAAATWQAVVVATIGSLENFHRDRPLKLGIDREGLRAKAAKGFPQEAWRALLDTLASEDTIELRGDQVCLAGHEVVLDAGRDEELQRIEQAFLNAGLTPPQPKEVAPGPSGAELVGLLVARGALVKLHDGKVFHAAALEELRRKLWEFAKQSPRIDVGAFKELAGLTRKHAIPLLEHLDAENTTRRVGNKREILPPR